MTENSNKPEPCGQDREDDDMVEAEKRQPRLRVDWAPEGDPEAITLDFDD